MAKPMLPTSSLPDIRIRAGSSLHPAFYVASWIFFSNVTILFNKWLIDNAGFPCVILIQQKAVILTWWHMTFATLATQFLARTTHLLDNRHSVKMTRPFYLKAVVPIGLLYSGSMVCSNLVYLYLNVAFIQMLKAASPFSTLVVAWLWGQEHLTMPIVLKIMVIVMGVLIASAGEIHFSWIGFFYQLGGLVFESIRVVMIQALMSGDDNSGRRNMDPLVSLYYYAPVCAVVNSFVVWATEWPSFSWNHVVGAGPWMLVLNGLIAFLLNVSSVMLIGKTSGLVLHLTGILKNILLVVASVFIWGTAITPLQIFGYGTALTGFVFYKSTWSDLKAGYTSWSARLRMSPGFGEKIRSPMARRVLGLLLAASILLVVYRYSPSDYLDYSAASSPPDQKRADDISKGWHMAGFGSSGK
ncbi:triose-phosphate transporter [Apiospora kogelbergensis]|uniref:Triose-phosphate transporter n=1 Tax=Apiospora kogelbergensis TaxID=1337665 RepID=A0AAW0QLP7_9PEZI